MQGLGMGRAHIESELWKADLSGAVNDVKASERLIRKVVGA